ncbi:CYFA0S05e00980g1_1 [Cyberlindnera fabianii]|uniref:DNA replication ATP-dependent helicase/nuclease n=1 Tax=Cyberlindnera fabianii TaxID=36022 RepID=A0A061AS93_CYBFA|nr:CYFA0S05e00980g1_1 [Cyberlindnera fabianii]
MAKGGTREAKRPRDEKENHDDAPVATKARTKYVFGPTNTLTGPAAKSQSTPLKQLKSDTSRKLDKKSTPKSTMTVKPKDSLSSDDIYWAPTPRQSRTLDITKLGSNDNSRNIPSSPEQDYKNIKLSPINPLKSFPHQYEGINYDNLISTQQSPEVNKTKACKSGSFPQCNSSVPSATRKPFSDKTKRLLRSFNGITTPISVPTTTKKRDIASLISTVERSTSRPSPFTPNSHLKDTPLCTDTPSRPPDETPSRAVPVIMRKEQLAEGVIIKEAEEPNQIKNENSSDVFSDDFSEDFMNELDRVMGKKTQQQEVLVPTTIAEVKTSVETVKQPVLIESSPARPPAPQLAPASLQNNDEDDLSDFDDSFNDMLVLKTQAPAPSSTISPLKMTTQERHIQSADRAGHLIFKKDIEATDTKFDSFHKEEANMAKSAVQRDGVHRFQVTHILQTHYVSEGRRKPQKIMTVVDGEGKTSKVFIRDLWETLSIQPKDVIHIIGDSCRIVDKDSDNMLVWNPDLLLSATLVSDTINCLRRSVIKTRYASPGESNIYLIVGEIVHSVFQAVLRENHCDITFMEGCVEKEIEQYILDILSIQETKESIRNQVKQHLPYIKTWFDLYVKENPNPAKPSSSVRINHQKERTLFSTNNIIDIEENIWSPIYGLRGLIDVTIEAYLSDSHNQGKFAVPMELKSGARMQISHKSQAALYTLLMKDRYEMDVSFFMLVYTKLRETTKNEISKRELKDLMMLRNTLSEFMKEGSRALPDLVRQSQCDRCYALQECMTLNKLTENGTEEGSGLAPGLFTNLTSHLDKPEYTTFFHYWDDLITKEEGTINLLKKDLFLTDSVTREKTSGKCLSNLVISGATEGETEENMTHIYTFKRKEDNKLPPLNVSQLSKHDRIIVSDERGHYALCSGFIVNVRPDSVVVSTNRRLKNNNMKGKDFDYKNNQTFQTVLRPLDDPNDYDADLTFRIDKDEMFHGMKLARFNLLNLFLKDGDHRRRELLVEGRKPTFNKTPLPYDLAQDHTFNGDQIKAFDKVLSANDFSLLLGMPGTGKTTVIAQLIRFLVKNNKTVLLTSYTHSAVDNILMKIKGEGIDILRLGNLSRIHQDCRELSPLNKDIRNAKDLKEVFLDPPVVATTCLGIGDWVFNERRFDYCIVDESSQVSMPVCLGPLRFCDKFVLVGDHYQLPPLIQNPEAKAGLSRSLFKILSDDFPEAVVDLSYQYRMCADIMLLSNTIIYEGRLKCGSENVANQSLKIPEQQKIKELVSNDVPLQNHWMNQILDENRKVVFLNHDNVGGCDETSVKENIENQKEAELVYQVVECMIRAGVPQESIGVMSFYRAQLRLFYRKFAARQEIEMLTADQFQGRDKDCVIISLVKSNKNNNVGSLLKEWRRLNVSITRARSKLIIIGSKSTLQSFETLNAFVKIMDSRGWCLDLPPDADKVYKIPAVAASPEKKRVANQSQKPMASSRVIEKHPLAREIAEEMDLRHV